MISQSKQQFRTFDAFTMLGLLTVCITLTSTIAASEFEDKRQSIAYSEAEKLAWQLEAGGFFNSSDEAKRKPSSKDSIKPGVFALEGFIGKDPWGLAFRYRVLDTFSSGEVRVLIWSLGPNRTMDTSDAKIQTMKFGSTLFSKDDVGLMHVISPSEGKVVSF